MSTCKCISCGAEKEAEGRCSCPDCGYTMFELPYDRKELLRGEIIRYINCFLAEEPVLRNSDFSGFVKDSKRFPSFTKIRSYIYDTEKAEDFISRIKESCEKLNRYIKKPFSAQYKADITDLVWSTSALTDQLEQLLDYLGLDCMISEPEWPKIIMQHSEGPNEARAAVCDVICQKQLLAADKLYDFIKRNNIYGDSYKDIPGAIIVKKSEDWDKLLKKCSDKLDEVLEKKYTIDLFDDGRNEAKEMMKAILDPILVILRSDAITEKNEFIVNGRSGLDETALKENLSAVYHKQFSELEKQISRGDFLSDRSAGRLFEIYDHILETDNNKYLKTSRGRMKVGETEKKLDDLIGLAQVKNSIQKIKAYAIANKGSSSLNLNMCFTGNPGTGKTEAARLIAGILHENGIISRSSVVEVGRNDLVGGYIGQTALKTMEVIESAMGGVLFIDEAYSLISNESPSDYGHEAVATLIKAMEDNRGRLCVILAGYKNKTEKMISENPGFRSRIQFFIDFPNYSDAELRSIALLMLKERGYMISDDAMNRVIDILSFKRKDPEFANAREVRNIIEQTIMCCNLRSPEEKKLELADVNSYIKDSGIMLPSLSGNAKKALTAEDELDSLVGLANIKRTVKKIKAYSKKNKNADGFNIHMCFYGNPGTGKTEVARIISRILYDAGALPEAKLTETDAGGLIAKYVGQTASKTQELIDRATGGVLFIDEAYSLTENSDHSYGDEAIAVLLKEMEDRRGRLCVILAGYREQMKAMIASNPGFDSRLQFKLDFPDYSQEELREIAERFLEKQGYDITDEASEKLMQLAEHFRSLPDFANARTVRNLTDQIIMNQNLRTEDSDGDMTVTLEDVEEYILDEGIDLSSAGRGRRIGFN